MDETSAFNEFSYYGSQPLDGRGFTVDVLVTKLSTLESRWYFEYRTAHWSDSIRYWFGR